jgi:6-phosphogluconolactonase
MTLPREIWVGTYTADSGRDGVGIGVLRLSDETLEPAQSAAPRASWLGRAVDAPSPSFVAVHPSLPIVYAVAERAGTVAAYRRAADVDGVPQLEPFGEPWAAGEAVCHIAVDPLGRYAVASCWGDGRVVLYELDPDGRIVSRFEGEPATDPHAAAALAEPDTAGMLARTGFAPRTSRAHCSLMLPDGRIMSTDLGVDLVRVWNYQPGTGLVLDHEITLPFWSGPRHLIAHPNGTVLIVTEYSVEVVVLSTSSAVMDAGAVATSSIVTSAGQSASRLAAPPMLPRYTVVQIGPATARRAQPFDGGAEIALSADAVFVYVTVRGSNTVTTLRVDDRGHVHPLADTSSGGNWPRHHLVLGRTLLIAHERSSDVTLFDLDPDTGLPVGPTQHTAVGAPTALVPA